MKDSIEKALSYIDKFAFSNKKRVKGDRIPKDKLKGYMSNDSIVAIIPKTNSFKERFLLKFEGEEIPHYSTTSLLTDDRQETTIKTKFLKNILKAVMGYNEVKIHVGNNKPVCFETLDFKFFIAPTLNSDMDVEEEE